MTTVKNIAKAHGRTIRTVQRWVRQARDKYPDMNWDVSQVKAKKATCFTDEQVLRILEFAPVEPAAIPLEDEIELLDPEIVEVDARESSGLALRTPTAETGMRINYSNIDSDLEQAKSLSLIRAGQTNNSVCSLGSFLGGAIAGELVRESQIMLANGKEAMQDRVNAEIKKAVG